MISLWGAARGKTEMSKKLVNRIKLFIDTISNHARIAQIISAAVAWSG
jgi:hypothetical protein